jgi:hypothetical protein
VHKAGGLCALEDCAEDAGHRSGKRCGAFAFGAGPEQRTRAHHQHAEQ